MGRLNIFLLTAIVASQTAELPPPFPRPGTTSLLENEAVAVWNVSWLKQQYPMHTHRYDLVGVSYSEGDRIIRQETDPGDSSPPRPGCSRRTAPTSRMWKKERAIHRCGQF